jgi:DNA-binding transcriptional MocR family regulator
MTVKKVTTQVSPFIMMNVPASVRNFIVGQPSEALIPHKMLNQAFTQALANNSDPYIFQYASSQGPLRIREDLSKFLSKTGRYPQNLRSDNICISFGNSQGIAAAISSLSKSGEVAIVEDPTYFLIGKILRDAGLVVKTCPVNASTGLDMDSFESLVRESKPRLVYVNPIHQNPTGSRMSIADRERLISLSIQHNFTIISDEPYVFLAFPDTPIDESFSSLGVTADRIASPDYRNLVCFGSFSKILTPGLRCGWISGHPETVSTIAAHGALASGGGPAPFISETVRQIIACNSLDVHIEFLRTELAKRAHAICSTLTSHLASADVEFEIPNGGYFVFLRVLEPKSFDAREFQSWLKSEGIDIRFLSSAQCSVNENQPCMRNGIRLAFSFYTPEEIEEAVGTLASELKRYILLL